MRIAINICGLGGVGCLLFTLASNSGYITYLGMISFIIGIILMMIIKVKGVCQ